METAIKQSRSVIRIAVIGPESTGKSILSDRLATHFETIWVTEFAREYLGKRNGEYAKEDLLTIAKGQISAENRLEKFATDLIICDTDLITIKIWSEFKYGECDPWILQQIQSRKHDLHLLCYPDIPWVADPLRENPDDREHIYSLYKDELLANSFPFVEIKGEKSERLKIGIEAIKTLVP